MMMADSEFPHDLLLLILIRFPLKSLLRFSCVSKSWNLLISTHLNRSLINPKPLGLIWNDILMHEERFYRMHIFTVDCSRPENLADTIQRLHHPLKGENYTESTLIGSCNGLLCATWVRDYKEFFFVFNPLTRKGSMISGGTSDCPKVRSYCYGFGYDDAHDDYKVVTWGLLGVRCDSVKFEVYSVKEASWTTRTSGLPDSYTLGTSCGVLVNCVLHWIWTWRKKSKWLSFWGSDPRYTIVAFDLRSEQQWLMEPPENYLAIQEIGIEGDYRCRMELGVLNGCLCGIEFCRDVPKNAPNKLNLWIMKEYGAKDSWTKMTIDLSCEHRFGWCDSFAKLGKMTHIVPIVNVESKKQMVLYSYLEGFLVCDMVNNQISKVIKIPEFDHHQVPIRDFWFVSKELFYEGSLVELPGFDSFVSLWNE